MSEVQTSVPAANDPSKALPAPPAPEYRKYNPETVSRIKMVLRNGGSRKAAYDYAGITPDSFYRWLKDLPEFESAVLEAEAEARVFVETQLWKNIKAGSGPDIRFWLERHAADSWKGQGITVGVRQDTHVHPAQGDRVSVASRISELSDKDLDDILRGAHKTVEPTRRIP